MALGVEVVGKRIFERDRIKKMSKLKDANNSVLY